MNKVNKITTSVKLDKDIKEKASELANQLGLSLSSVVNATLRQFVAEKGLSLQLDPPFNKKTEKEMLKIMDDIEKGKNLVGPFETVEELEKDLRSKLDL